MSDATYHIGDQITFTCEGTTLEGVIRGVELVDDPRRKCGIHFLVTTAALERFDIVESQVGSLVGAEPCVT